MKKAIQYIPLVLIILLMSMPAIQMRWQIFDIKPLDGAFTLAEQPHFTKKAWNSGEFQEGIEKYLKDNAGFRPFLVRLQNQVDYTFFRKGNAEGATIGKTRQLYEYDYIRSWLAIDDPGDIFITKKLNRARYVQDYLKREKGIDLEIVFEPGKASFYPEYIPRKYTEKKNGPSTYERFVQKAKETGLDYIDWEAWFQQLKPTSEYPLFPKYGTHWSVYGMKFAADSMLRFIGNRRGIKLGEFKVDRTETSRKPRDTDDDVARTMNLLFPPSGELLAYPIFSFDTTNTADRPMVLVVADSYYWNIFNTRIPKNLFANEAFWYFNALVYPDYYYKPVRTENLDLLAEVEKQDVIFLMITERFVHKFDWMFIDNLYKLYTPEWLVDPVYDNINRIMQHDPWYNDVIVKAKKNGISLEDALILDARYVYNMDDTAGFMIRFGPLYYRRMISNDPGWTAKIREKAAGQGISEDEMLEKDALFMFRQNYPSFYEMNRAITAKEEALQADPAAMDSVNRMSEQYRFDKEQMLWLCAERGYREDEINRISQIIRSDEKWLADVKKKALEQNIPLDEMIRKDAVWVYEQKFK